RAVFLLHPPAPFSLQHYRAHPDLPSFPTRRSSDLTLVMSAVFVPAAFLPGPTGIFYRQFSLTVATSIVLSGIVALTLTPALCPRSEEHTSELQSRENLVCRLLLEKKKMYGKITQLT